jgi:hypothetical protein
MSDTVLNLIEAAFNRDDLKRICEMGEREFAAAYDMETVKVHQRAPHDVYYFKDNGADVLAVAHLDTVVGSWQRECNFLDTQGGTVVYSGALDDRLGAYIILELLPKLGITYDILLTVGEESGLSTAAFFDAPKDYNYLIEFDRGGTDVVMYQYEDSHVIELVEASGARVAEGIFSDISYLEHLERKAFNWGVGYRDYHGVRSHAYLDDTFSMVRKYLKFHVMNADTPLPHDRKRFKPWWEDSRLLDEEEREARKEQRECDRIFGDHMHDDEECAEVLGDLFATAKVEETK